MDDPQCPLCSPASTGPVIHAAELRIGRSYYVELMEEAARASGMLECQAAPDRWFSAETMLSAKNACKGELAGTRRCPLIDLCAMTALVSREEFGVWGGMSPRERRVMLRKTGM